MDLSKNVWRELVGTYCYAGDCFSRSGHQRVFLWLTRNNRISVKLYNTNDYKHFILNMEEYISLALGVTRGKGKSLFPIFRIWRRFILPFHLKGSVRVGFLTIPLYPCVQTKFVLTWWLSFYLLILRLQDAWANKIKNFGFFLFWHFE